MRRSLAIAAISGSLLAGGAVGVLAGNPAISGAQSAAPSAAPSGAKGHQRLDAVLAPLVTDGTLNQAQADAVIKALEAARPEGGRGPGGEMLRAGLQAAATALGMSPDEVRTQLQSGQTLGQIADAKGVSRTDLVAALVAEARTHLAEAVTKGRLTQAQADARAAELESRLPGMLDRQLPGPRGGHAPGMRAGGPGGMRHGGPAPAGGSSTGA